MIKNIADENDELKPYEYQMSGHYIDDGCTKIGLLKHRDGYVLKPAHKPVKAECEINFYEAVWIVKDHVLSSVKTFIPEFLGTTILNINNKDIKFIKLQNLTFGFEKPCIADIKIGKQTWDPSASPKKRIIEDSKYTYSKVNFGFCITGYQVYNVTTKELIKRDKMFGRKLNINTVPLALKEFLNENEYCATLSKIIIDKLKPLFNWWQVQKYVHMYSSSLLLLYDASKLNSEFKTTEQYTECIEWIRVYMIDFAHVVFTNNDQIDTNYLQGLDSLINVLKSLTIS